MGSCSLEAVDPGDTWAGLKKFLSTIVPYAGLIGMAALSGFLIGGAAGAAVAAMGAAAGVIILACLIYTVKWFRRLKKHDPERIELLADAVCVGRNTGILPPPYHDGDWIMNIQSQLGHAINFPTIDMLRIHTEAAPGSALPQAYFSMDKKSRLVLHTEISSYQGDLGAIWTTVSAIVGAIVGAIIGGYFFGPIGIAAGALIGAFLGAISGAYTGKLLGMLVDEISDFDEIVEDVTETAESSVIYSDVCLIVRGVWVTDTEHQWNELHDVESVLKVSAAEGYACRLVAAASGIGMIPWGDPTRRRPS
jgi:hypothetical protein